MSHDLLNSVAATTTHRDRDDLDHAIARLLLQFLSLHSATVLRLEDDGDGKRIVRSVSQTQRSGDVGPVAVDRNSTYPALADFPSWHKCALHNEVVQCDGADGRLMTVFPIHGGRETTGLLVIEALSPLAPRETDLVQGILGILRNHLALLDYGELDSLTGLLNRKTFESHFDKLRQRIHGAQADRPARPPQAHSSDPGEPSWLALIDIDHFKSINDGYGHLFGDEVLLLVSQLMKRSFRGADQQFRFGGEEFVVVLDHATTEGVEVAFDRLRETIAAFEFPQVGRVTISLGYSQIYPTDSPSTCVERADAALYYAKHHGRNNIRSYEMLVAAGELSAKD